MYGGLIILYCFIADNVRAMPRVEKRIARMKKAAQKQTESDNEDEQDNDDTDLDSDPEENGMNEEDEKEYFAEVVDSSNIGGGLMFSQLNLSRPFLRAIEHMGYTQPTPIQVQVIPYALAGRDVCASAVTGSGKTAAFVLPFLERLLYRPRDNAAIRVLVITPTRELAMQIHEVLVKLAQFTDVTCCLIVGGKRDVRVQEVTLRQRPDVIICTPGRMLDHLRNSQSVSLDDLDVLVLDEVDRLLDLGFQQEVEELVKHCPLSRQTLLFSATMTPRVEDLVKLSLKRPVRVKVDGKASTIAPRLVQEFIKVRDKDEVECMLAALVCRDFGEKTIVFFELKRLAHRFCAILNLLKVRAVELHGDLPQAQRYTALEKFRQGEVDVLVATDVAARGLDIQGVQTVINSEMPRDVSTYVHRVGRTARAGCGGRAITLVSDERRKVMKEVLKGEGGKMSSEQGGQILSRTIASSVLVHYSAKMASIEEQVEGYLETEKDRLRLEAMEREAERAENLLQYSEQIQSRPARTWFQTETQKTELREKVRARQHELQEKAKGLSAEEQARKMAMEDDYRDDKDEKHDKHRMSRKKKRRIEALKASEEADEETGKGHVGIGAVKKAKKRVRDKAEEKKEKTLGEMSMKKVWVTEDFGDDGDDLDDGAKKKPAKKKLKVVRQRFAVGGLDVDDWEGGSGFVRKKAKASREKEDFSDFDPLKRLRKGGKKSNASFKSKAKFKRRK
ncbi:DEAD/DEAH box helicase [archaeon]|nr:MAG: DEAD/DEAH box helicase [archaeon]